MKIKHYRAPDMRQALRQVRDTQGPDAVILSSKRIAGGVEVVAAVDYDVAESQAANYGAEDSYGRQATAYGQGSGSRHAPGEESYAVAAESGRVGYGRDAAAQASPSFAPSFDGIAQEERAFSLSQAPDPAPQASTAMSEELRTLRQMLETQLATLAWNDLSRRAPLQTELLKQLTVLGIANDLAGELVAQLPSKLELAEAHRLALALLSRRIAVTEERWIEHGGMIAMVRALTGTSPTAVIGDSHLPESVKTRTLAEETKRVFRARVVNPRWIAAMQRHGYKGAFELAATVDYLFGYDATAGVVDDWMYESLAASYVFDADVRSFMERSNPWALRGITERLIEAADRGLWAAPDPETLSRLRDAYLAVEGELEA